RQINRRRARPNRGFAHPAQIIPIAARGILCGKFDRRAELTCVLYHRFDTLERLFLVDVELMLQVNLGRCKEHMNNGMLASRTASQAASISVRVARASPATAGPRTARAI